MALNDPNLGLTYGWAQGENGWGTGMDANLKRLGAVVGLSVKDRDLTAPPANPTNGDRYIIPSGATGDWSGKTNQIAVRIAGAWEYYAPKIGWVCYVEDESVLIVYKAAGWGAAASALQFYKADPTTVAFTKTGANTAEVKAGTVVGFSDGTTVTYSSATAITMPSLTAGTDYAIWANKDGSIQATTDFASPPQTGSRKIGGFHYAPGGNATAQAGGDTTPAINAYSFWDLKFRPACFDPRGMTLVADSFWADIYLLGVDHHINGTSKYNVTIADGSSPPKIPTKFGGNGSTTYSTFNWWEACEVLQSWGKRPPTYNEFAALAYGTTEATSSDGSDVPTTGQTGSGATNAWNKFTSKWGCIQSTGCMWVWGANFGGGAAGAGWTANTGGRGSNYQMENVARFGGAWFNAAVSGSRASAWQTSPTSSYNAVGARGVCDHLILD